MANEIVNILLVLFKKSSIISLCLHHRTQFQERCNTSFNEEIITKKLKFLFREIKKPFIILEHLNIIVPNILNQITGKH
jgi:hypothetical protein